MGLLVWLKAGEGFTEANGRVVSWADHSGGAAATAPSDDARPVLVQGELNGKPALHTEGLGQMLSRTTVVDGLEGVTLVAVNKTATYWTDRQDEWCHHAGCDPQGPAGPRLVSETGCSGTYQHMFWWDGKKTGNGYVNFSGLYMSPKQNEVSFRFGVGVETYSPDPCSIVHDPHVAWTRPASIHSDYSLSIGIHDRDTNYIFVHGEQVSKTPSSGGHMPIISGERMDIGNGTGGLSGTNRGSDIVEIMVYARALPEGERQAVERYIHCNLFPNLAK